MTEEFGHIDANRTVGSQVSVRLRHALTHRGANASGAPQVDEVQLAFVLRHILASRLNRCGRVEQVVAQLERKPDSGPDAVEGGQRIGMIRFGSRVDVYLPAGTGPRVLLGQRTIAGETVIAELGVQPATAGISQ